MTDKGLMMDREQLAALSRRTKRDSYEILLSSLELPLAVELLILGLLQAAARAIPRWLPAISGLLMWYAAYRLYRHYEQQLGKVKPPLHVLIDLYMIFGLVAFVVLSFSINRWLEQLYPQLLQELRFWGFIPTSAPKWALTFYLPLGVHLRNWRWVGASLWIILGEAALFLALPELGTDRFLLLGFLIPGTGYALSGALFLRQVQRRVREFAAFRAEESHGSAV